MTSALRAKLLKNTKIKATDVLTDSKIYNTKDLTPTPVPGINIAFSGEVAGGFGSGLTIWAGPSRHFKTLFSLIAAASYLHAYPDAVMLFYDSEFGSPPVYFRTLGIDPDRVVHTPILSVEQLREDIANQLVGIEKGDKVIIVVDSIGNLASNKESEDAVEGKNVADMTRAKVIKSLFRIVTPHLRIKNIPMIAVAHTYDTMETYSKKVVGGGTGPMYSADNVFIIGRQQDKEGTGATAELLGYDFIINVEKSRYVREKSKIPITVGFNKGIMKWSGLFDLALQGGFLVKVGKMYSRVDGDGVISDDKAYRKNIENNGEFWKAVLSETTFDQWIKERYTLGMGEMISEDENVDDILDEDDQELDIEMQEMLGA